jgi:hypothetical protein
MDNMLNMLQYIDKNKLLNFDPTSRDGLVMFCLYVSLIMFLYGSNGVGLVFGTISIFIYLTTKKPKELPKRMESIDNPYANTLFENDQLIAEKSNSDKEKEYFNDNLYRNETDLFDRKSMQFNFYREEGRYPNDINKLLKYFKSDKRCKAENVNCSYPSFFLQ